MPDFFCCIDELPWNLKLVVQYFQIERQYFSGVTSVSSNNAQNHRKKVSTWHSRALSRTSSLSMWLCRTLKWPGGRRILNVEVLQSFEPNEICLKEAKRFCSRNSNPRLHSGKFNIAMKNGPGWKMYFLLKMGIFQPAMLVYQRVSTIFPLVNFRNSQLQQS